MASLNQCNFIGNCADAPEVRTFNDGGKIANVRVAVTERFTDRSGQQRENTEWISCVFNGKQADTAEKYLQKGSTVFVTGKYHTRQWQDQQGNKHFATEISVMGFQILDKRQQQQPAQAHAPAPGYAPQFQQPAPQPPSYQPTVGPIPQGAPVAQPLFAPNTSQAPAPAPASAPAPAPYVSNDPDLPF